MKRIHVESMIVFLFFMLELLGSGIAEAQSTGLPQFETSERVSKVETSANLLTELMEIAAENNLDWRKCDISTRMDTLPFQHFNLEMTTENLKPLAGFIDSVKNRWKTSILFLSAKPFFGSDSTTGRIQINMRLAFYPGGITKSLDEILDPLGNLDFFTGVFPSASSRPLLFGFEYEDGKGTQFKVVAERLSDLNDLAKTPRLPGRSKTISKSRLGEKVIFNLDFSRDIAFPLSGDLIAKFDSLSKVADVQEISWKDQKGQEKTTEILLTTSSEKLPALAEIFLAPAGWHPLKCEITAKNNLDWFFQFSMRPQERPENFDYSNLKKLFEIPFPSELREKLRIIWTPLKTLLSIDVGADPGAWNSEQMKKLKSDLQQAGFNPEGSKSFPATGEKEAFVQYFFGKSSALASGKSLQSGADAFQSFLAKTEVLEQTSMGNEKKYVLRLPYKLLPDLFQCLIPKENLSLTEFSLSCNHPHPAVVRVVVSEEKLPRANEFFRFIQGLTSPKVPWDIPEEQLKEKLIVHEVSVFPDGNFEISGQTLKSRLIFSQLFPILNSFGLESEPFFQSGNYRDHQMGRLMTFKVTGKGPAAR